MSFAYLAGVITQTGTDTDLSGLNGLTSVTRLTQGTGDGLYTIYELAGSRLVINGTVTHNPDQECILFNFSPTSTLPCIDVTGTYNYGAIYTGNGKTNYAKGTGIISTAQTTDVWRMAIVWVRSGGTLNWDGGIIVSGSMLQFANGAYCNQESGTFFNTHASATHQIRLETTTAANDARLVFNNITLDGVNATPVMFTTRGWGTLSVNFRLGGFQNYVDLAIPVTLLNANFDNNRSSRTMLFNTNSPVNVVESTWLNPSEKVLAQTYGLSTNKTGISTSKRDITLVVTDIAGSAVESTKFYAIDEDSGDRRSINSIDYTADQVYSGVTSAGTVDIDAVLINVQTVESGETLGQDDDRFTDDEMDVAFCGYNYLLAQTPIPLYGNDTLIFTWTMLPESLITQSTKATVDAYATLDDAYEVYDRAKAYLYDNFLGETALLISRAGLQLEIGANDLTIDATAASVFALSGADITIKSTTFTGGVIGTTGIVTLNNGATINGGTFDCDVYLNSAQDLTDVTINGDLRIATGANSTLDFSNVTVTGNVYNDSASNTLLIILSNGSSISAGDPGSGNGQTDVIQTAPIKVTVKDIEDGTLLGNARVFIKAATGGDLPASDTVTITRVSTTATVSHTAHGMVNNEYILIEDANEGEYNGAHQITYIDANSYSYTVSGTPATPATGTITATARLVNELTDENGEVNETHRFTSDQPVEGVVRKATL
ncbi:MAG: hypothetical protein BBJ57_07535 [Desulfobacterales bacterium PC51MH44]|nr:MAG: hypothetical protein BBJ57_07535 [Desulfobacterales bacterium PC51MH44]